MTLKEKAWADDFCTAVVSLEDAESAIRAAVDREREACAKLADFVFDVCQSRMEGTGEPEFSSCGAASAAAKRIAVDIRSQDSEFSRKLKEAAESSRDSGTTSC